MDRPTWWEWELDCTNPHLLKRMIDRAFNEADLRDLLETAYGWRPNHMPGRFEIDAVRGVAEWKVIVEPDEPTHPLIVVTAYAADEADA